MTDIAIEKVNDYDVEKVKSSLIKMFDLTAFPTVEGKRVLIKPNILSDVPKEKAITTNPVIVEALIDILKDKGALDILVGDSPGLQSPTFSAKTSGIRDVIERKGVRFEDFAKKRLNFSATHSDSAIEFFLNQFGYPYHSDIDEYNKKIANGNYQFEGGDRFNYFQHISNIYQQREIVPDFFLLPDQILLLNFNYTTTADMYLYKNSGFEVNHIHGTLGDDLNHIIFGYGDEMDDDYKTISKLNDNDYLTNIKSIRYLETDKYRQLLRFINSDYYQIYIMGHSCGNSDRTLLNTLFEHPKCVSIKPFYYQWQDERGEWQDNYIEIIQNISRNFNSMQTMRDRVVNKEFCRPLVPKDN